MNRQEAIELARRIKAIRKEKALGYHVLLRLREMPFFEREAAMERMVQKGYADSVEEIRRMLRSKEVSLDIGAGDSPTESTGMSDDVLDRCIHYINVNKDLL